MPSAGRPFTKRALTRLRERGVSVQRIVLHTGVSSQERGERPYPERYGSPLTPPPHQRGTPAGPPRDRGRHDRRPGARDRRRRRRSVRPGAGWTSRRSRPNAAYAPSTASSPAGTSPTRATADARGDRRPPAARALLRRRRRPRLPLARIRRPAPDRDPRLRPCGPGRTPAACPGRDRDGVLGVGHRHRHVEWSENMGPFSASRAAPSRGLDELLERSSTRRTATRWRAVETAIEQGTAYELDLRVTHPDRGERWLHTRARAMRGAGRTHGAHHRPAHRRHRAPLPRGGARVPRRGEPGARGVAGPGANARGGRPARRAAAGRLVHGAARRRHRRQLEQVAVAHVDPEKVAGRASCRSATRPTRMRRPARPR